MHHDSTHGWLSLEKESRERDDEDYYSDVISIIKTESSSAHTITRSVSTWCRRIGSTVKKGLYYIPTSVARVLVSTDRHYFV